MVNDVGVADRPTGEAARRNRGATRAAPERRSDLAPPPAAALLRAVGRAATRSAHRPAAALALLGALGCAAPAPAQADLDALVYSIATTAIDGGSAAGVSVGVRRAGEIVLLRDYGWADLHGRIPLAEGAVHEVGSITKQFTAAALLRLAERGTLSLDDSLVRWIPEMRDPRASAVTLRHLLHHTSGIPDFVDLPGFRAALAAGADRHRILDLILAEPLRFEPGEAMLYGNSGYFLLGIVLERATGADYAEVLSRELLEPAGLTRTRYCPPTPDDPRRSRGHGASPLGLLPTEPLDHSWPFAAGSLCASAADLLHWTTALHRGDLLADSTLATLLRPGRLADGTPLRYAAGLMLDSIAGRPAFHHGGALPGSRAHLAHLPDDDLTIVVLTNTSGGLNPRAAVDRIASMLLGSAPPEVPDLPLPRPAAYYAGEYLAVWPGTLPPVTLLVTPEGRLALSVDGGPAEPLRHLGGDRFAARHRRIDVLPTDPPTIRVDAVGSSVVHIRGRSP